MVCKTVSSLVPAVAQVAIPAKLPTTQSEWSAFVRQLYGLLNISQNAQSRPAATSIPLQFATLFSATLPPLQTTGCTVTADNSWSLFGGYSYKVQITATNASVVFGASGFPCPIPPNENWLFSVYGKCSAASQSFKTGLQTANGTYENTAITDAVAATVDRFAIPLNLVADDASACTVRLDFPNSSGDTFWFDGFQYEPSVTNSVNPSPFLSTNIIAGSIIAQYITVANLAALSANMGTLTAGKIASSDGRFTVDCTNELITITDGTNTRMQIGQISSGVYDIKIWNGSGTLLFDAASGLQYAGNTASVQDTVASSADSNGSYLQHGVVFQPHIHANQIGWGHFLGDTSGNYTGNLVDGLNLRFLHGSMSTGVQGVISSGSQVNVNPSGGVTGNLPYANHDVSVRTTLASTAGSDGSYLDNGQIHNRHLNNSSQSGLADDSNAKMFRYGTFANRPAFGTSGRIYHAYDEGDNGITYRDTGSAWTQMAVGHLADISGTTDNVVVGSATTTQPIRAAADNLADNGDFESWLNGVSVGWHNGTGPGANPAAAIAQDTSPYAGTYCVKITTDTGSYEGIVATKYFPVTPGQACSVSLALKSDGTHAVNGGLWFSDESNNFKGAVFVPGVTSSSWVYQTATSTVPAGATRMYLATQGPSPGGSFSYWADSFTAQLGTQTVNIPSGAKAYINFSDNTTDGHIDKNLDNIADGVSGNRNAVLAVDSNKRALIDLSQSHVNKTMDYMPDGTSRLGWKQSQQTALLTNPGPNHIYDPSFTSIADFWGNVNSASAGVLNQGTVGASGYSLNNNYDGRGNLVKVKAVSGDTIVLQLTSTQAPTGTAVTYLTCEFFTSAGAHISYGNNADAPSSGTGTATSVSTAPANCAYANIFIQTYGAASGGNAALVTNPICRINHETVADVNALKAYIDANDTTAGGHVGLTSYSSGIAITSAIQAGTGLTDGGTVTFSSPLASTPVVIFGDGGVTYDSGLTGSQYQSFIPTFTYSGGNCTGFTAALKINSLAGASTNQSVNFSSNSATLTVPSGDDIVNGALTVNASLSDSGNEPATVTVTDTSTGKTLFQKIYYKTQTLAINCTDASAVNGTVITISCLGAIVTGSTITYKTATAPTSHSATPSGVPGINWTAFATS